MIITDKDIRHCAKRNDGEVVCTECVFFWLNLDMRQFESACFTTWQYVEFGTPFTATHTYIKDVV